MDGQMAEWVSFLHYLPAASPSVSCLFILTFLGIKKKKKKQYSDMQPVSNLRWVAGKYFRDQVK